MWNSTNCLNNAYINNTNNIDSKYSLKVLGKSYLAGSSDLDGTITFKTVPTLDNATPTFTTNDFITKSYADTNYMGATGATGAFVTTTGDQSFSGVKSATDRFQCIGATGDIFRGYANVGYTGSTIMSGSGELYWQDASSSQIKWKLSPDGSANFVGTIGMNKLNTTDATFSNIPISSASYSGIIPTNGLITKAYADATYTGGGGGITGGYVNLTTAQTIGGIKSFTDTLQCIGATGAVFQAYKNAGSTGATGYVLIDGSANLSYYDVSSNAARWKIDTSGNITASTITINSITGNSIPFEAINGNGNIALKNGNNTFDASSTNIFTTIPKCINSYTVVDGSSLITRAYADSRYTGAGNFVTIDTSQNITAQKTFSANVVSNNLRLTGTTGNNIQNRAIDTSGNQYFYMDSSGNMGFTNTGVGTGYMWQLSNNGNLRLKSSSNSFKYWDIGGNTNVLRYYNLSSQYTCVLNGDEGSISLKNGSAQKIDANNWSISHTGVIVCSSISTTYGVSCNGFTNTGVVEVFTTPFDISGNDSGKKIVVSSNAITTLNLPYIASSFNGGYNYIISGNATTNGTIINGTIFDGTNVVSSITLTAYETISIFLTLDTGGDPVWKYDKILGNTAVDTYSNANIGGNKLFTSLVKCAATFTGDASGNTLITKDYADTRYFQNTNSFVTTNTAQDISGNKTIKASTLTIDQDANFINSGIFKNMRSMYSCSYFTITTSTYTIPDAWSNYNINVNYAGTTTITLPNITGLNASGGAYFTIVGNGSYSTTINTSAGTTEIYNGQTMVSSISLPAGEIIFIQVLKNPSQAMWSFSKWLGNKAVDTYSTQQITGSKEFQTNLIAKATSGDVFQAYKNGTGNAGHILINGDGKILYYDSTASATKWEFDTTGYGTASRYILTPTGSTNVITSVGTAGMFLIDNPIYLRTQTDANHYIKFVNTNANSAGGNTTVDGVWVMGNRGGVLASQSTILSTQIHFQWKNGNNYSLVKMWCQNAIDVSGGLTVSSGSVTLPANSIADAALSTNIPKKDTTNIFTQLLTASGGLTVSGSLTLPSTSVADSALSSNVTLLNNTQTFSGAKSFSSLLTASGGLTTTNITFNNTNNLVKIGTSSLSSTYGTGTIGIGNNAGAGLVGNASLPCDNNISIGESLTNPYLPIAASVKNYLYKVTNESTMTATNIVGTPLAGQYMVSFGNNQAYRTEVSSYNLGTGAFTFISNIYVNLNSYCYFYSPTLTNQTGTYTGSTGTGLTSITIATGLSISTGYRFSYQYTDLLGDTTSYYISINSYNSTTGQIDFPYGISITNGRPYYIFDFQESANSGYNIDNNVAIGKYALQNISTNAEGNTALGLGALNGSNSSGTADNKRYLGGAQNTAVGKWAGALCTASNSNNTFLGAYADIIDGSNNYINNSTAVGYGAKITKSNQIMLGSSSDVVNVGGIFERGTSGWRESTLIDKNTYTSGTVNILESQTGQIFTSNVSSGNMTFNLPNTPTKGTTFIIQNINIGTCFINVTGTGTFSQNNSSSTQIRLYGGQYNSVQLIWNSLVWYVVGGQFNVMRPTLAIPFQSPLNFGFGGSGSFSIYPNSVSGTTITTNITLTTTPTPLYGVYLVNAPSGANITLPTINSALIGTKITFRKITSNLGVNISIGAAALQSVYPISSVTAIANPNFTLLMSSTQASAEIMAISSTQWAITFAQ